MEIRSSSSASNSTSSSSSNSNSPPTLKFQQEIVTGSKNKSPLSFFLLLASLKNVEQTWKLKGCKITDTGTGAGQNYLQHIDNSHKEQSDLKLAVDHLKSSPVPEKLCSEKYTSESDSGQVQANVHTDTDIEVKVNIIMSRAEDSDSESPKSSTSTATTTTTVQSEYGEYAGIEYYNSNYNSNPPQNTNAKTRLQKRFPRNRDPSNSGMRNTTPILSQVFSLFSKCHLMPYTYSKKEMVLENCGRAQLVQFHISLALNFLYTFYTSFRIFSMMGKTAHSKKFSPEEAGELNVMISQFSLTTMVLIWQFNTYKYRNQIRVFVNQLHFFRTKMFDEKTVGLRKDFLYIKFFLLIFTARIVGTLISAVKNPNKYQFMYSSLPRFIKTGRWNWICFIIHLLFTTEYLLGSYLFAFTVNLFPFILYMETVHIFLKAKLMGYGKGKTKDDNDSDSDKEGECQGQGEDMDATLKSYKSLLILSTQFNFCYAQIILPGATSILICMGIAAAFSFIKFFSLLHTSQLLLVALPLLVIVRMVPWLFPACAQISSMSQEWLRQIHQRMTVLSIKIDKNREDGNDDEDEYQHQRQYQYHRHRHSHCHSQIQTEIQEMQRGHEKMEMGGNKRRFSMIPLNFNHHNYERALRDEKRVVQSYLKSLYPVTINIGSFFSIKRVTCLTISSFIVVQTISLLFIFKQ